ncbi:MAG TPA: hypothetical protein VII13_16665 [Vicinamibacteria bacterium]|jgi:hypothetical protein
MLTPAQGALALASEAGLLAACAGLFRRRRLDSCWTFTAYLCVVFAGEALVLCWPARFYNLQFWVLKEAAYDTLKLGIALELSARTFQAFPGAAAFARAAAVAVAVVTATVLVVLPASPGIVGQAAQLHPRVLSGTIWLMASVLALAVWFRVPMEPLHKAILLGFVPYLFIFSTGLSLLDLTDWGFRPWFNRLNPVAYFAVTVLWAHAAWRRREAEGPVGQALAVAGA